MANSTICAISTPIGNGGISIVRMSGENSKSILEKIINQKISGFEERKLYLKKINTKNFNDNALVVFFNNPNSYTGEDMVEIQCHGGVLIAKGILEELIENGAIMAEPGEFTKRAFLSGKISLDKAEGVIDMINAESTNEIKAGYNLLNGKLFEIISSTQSFLTDCLAEIDVSIDYPENDIEYITSKKITEKLIQAHDKVENLLKTVQTGSLVKNGINVLILGKPNVGKSSLLNAMLGTEKAIVTSIAGTTRDVIEDKYSFNGMCFNIMDTAGIRESDNIVESMGINKALDCIRKADIVLFVIDSSDKIDEKDKKIFELVKNKKIILVINKSDLTKNADLTVFENLEKIEISALENKNINNLKQMIFDKVVDENLLNSQILITNSRHENALRKALLSIEKALNSLNTNASLDLVALDVQDSWNALGEITGQTSTEQIIDTIFMKFCLGK